MGTSVSNAGFSLSASMLLGGYWLRPLYLLWIVIASCTIANKTECTYVQRAQSPGLWQHHDYQVHQAWLRQTAQHVLHNPKELHPAVAELRDLIENDSRIYLLASGMYEDIPINYTDPRDLPVIRNYEQMLQVMNHLITTAPAWNEHESQIGLIGLPMHALLDWPMGTFYGFDFFLDPQVNAVLKKILNAWGIYLNSPASAEVLGNSTLDWFGPTALHTLTSTANVEGSTYSFEELFVCDPTKKNYGFTSWNNFFTRRFYDDKRPVVAPNNHSIINNVCESMPYAIAHNVKRRDKFWMKGQPYSVQDMLAHDELSEQFVGGTVYQAFLSYLSYHHWHAPVSGKIVKITRIDGTYFSEPLFEILEHFGSTPRGPRHAQGYLTVVAARTVVYIMADNPNIGLVAIVQVGMSEVSSCEVTVVEGQRVEKGDEIGMFHFGGSTYCLLFRKGVEVIGLPEPGERIENVPVRGQLGVVLGTSHVDEL